MVKYVAISNEFWEDMDWTEEHYSDLQRKYKDKWVAVVGKKVVSFAGSMREAREEAKKLTGRKEVYTVFVESGAAIY